MELSMIDQSLAASFRERAEAGDGAFAIAYAILQLAGAQQSSAAAIKRLGNGEATSHLGAIEGLSLTIDKAAQVIARARR
jgi:hypothetical protein